MAFGTKVSFEAVREVAAASITSSYTAVGTALIDHARLIGINNSTDVDLYISLDGTTNHIRVAAGGFKLYDFTTNRVTDDGFFVNVGTIFYVKRVSGAASTGTVWIEVIYATGGV